MRLRDPRGKVHTAAFGDPLRHAVGAINKPAAVVAVAEELRHRAAGGAGETVGDEPFESVSGLDPHLAVVDRQHEQRAIVLALHADALAVVLKHLQSVRGHVGVRLERLDGRDDHHVTGGFLELANQRIELLLGRAVDNVRKIVHGRRQLGWFLRLPFDSRVFACSDDTHAQGGWRERQRQYHDKKLH